MGPTLCIKQEAARDGQCRKALPPAFRPHQEKRGTERAEDGGGRPVRSLPKCHWGRWHQAPHASQLREGPRDGPSLLGPWSWGPRGQPGLLAVQEPHPGGGRQLASLTPPSPSRSCSPLAAAQPGRPVPRGAEPPGSPLCACDTAVSSLGDASGGERGMRAIWPSRENVVTASLGPLARCPLTCIPSEK